MGIPRLTGLLSPHAEQRSIHDTEVVVDGPALAYHVIHLCSSKTGGDNPFSQPTYDVLGKTAIAWLDELQLCGITVSALYFDGYLPEPKRPTRLDRACRTSRALNNFFLATVTGIPRAKPDEKASREPDLSTLNLTTVSQRGAGGLPPAFAVPAILEALRRSDRYGPRTRLVPGEADSYCADHVRVHGGTILTSDSDLLVFDLGPRGNVAFFGDIELASTATTHRVTAAVYSPTLIQKNLALGPKYGLSALAFEVARDPHLPWHKLLQHSREGTAIREYPDEYERFMIPYLPVLADSSGLGFSLPAAFHTTSFDARVSELVLQCLRPSIHPGEPGDQPMPMPVHDDSVVLMFLPQLYESWSRVSAWEISSSLRHFAYGLTQYAAGRGISTVVEYRRLISPSSRGRVAEVVPLAAIARVSSNLLSLVNKIRDGGGAPELQWVVLSMFQDIEWSRSQDKESLVLRLLCRETDPNGILDPSSWDAAHLSAQLQGTYYSLRILKQILEFVCQEIEGLPDPVGGLQEALAHLPSFSSYPSLDQLETLPGKLREAGSLELLAKLAGLSEAIEFKGGKKGSRKKATDKKRKRDSAQESAPSPRSQNPFAALALDKS